MDPQKQVEQAGSEFSFSLLTGQNGRQRAQILVVSEDDSVMERLARALPAADFSLEHARSITAGCELARSGYFQVIVTAPLFSDGSWRRLADIATHYNLGFVVIVITTSFDEKEYAEALEYGVFDVLDVFYELPGIAQSVKCAAWAAYLKGAGPCIE